MSTSEEKLCECLPTEFATYINYVRSLRFEEKPDYTYLRALFRRLFTSRGFKYDNVFDWTERMFNEIHGEAPANMVNIGGAGETNKEASDAM
jgi:hypothetical protein